MKKLCLIIPTCGRPDSIRFYLKEQAEALFRNGIDLILYDSSPDGSTQEIAEQFLADGFQNIRYERDTGEQERMAIDRKVFRACEEYAPRYDYIWLSSDGTVIDIDAVFGAMKPELDRGTDLVVFDSRDCMGFSFREYTDCGQLFHDCCWRMTSLSAGIVSGELLRRAMQMFPVWAEDNYGLWLPMAYFRAIASQPFRAVYFVKQNSWRANPMREDSFWKLSCNTLWQWGEIWCRAVCALPGIYNPEKEFVLKSHDRYTGIFSLRNLPGLKATGSLSWKKVRSCREYLPQVTDTGIFWFYFFALCVNRRFAVGLRAVYRKGKRKTGREQIQTHGKDDKAE